MSTRYNKSPYTARAMLRCSPLRNNTLKQIEKVVMKEVHQLCSMKYGSSVLRNTSPIAVTNFSWKPVVAELKRQAPVLYSIVKAGIGRSKKSVDPRTIATTLAVLLKFRSKCMSSLQAVVSLVLYVGHSSKMVLIVVLSC